MATRRGVFFPASACLRSFRSTVFGVVMMLVEVVVVVVVVVVVLLVLLLLLVVVLAADVVVAGSGRWSSGIVCCGLSSA